MDFGGFKKENGKYNPNFYNEFSQQSQIEKFITNPSGIDILIIKGGNYQDATIGYPLFGLGAGWIGATFNTTDLTYPGFVFQMKITDKLTQEVFEHTLSTIRFTN